MKNLKVLTKLVCITIIFIQSTQACVIELINDSNKPILIVTDDLSEGILVPNNGTFTFGSKAYMANFRVMQQNENNFSEQYHLQQTTCTPTKYMQLKISEINPNNSNIPFTISKTEILSNKSECGCKH